MGMDIQQWIGLIGVVAYWLFRAYTASKKGSKTAPAPDLKAPKPEVKPRTESPKPLEPMAPSKPAAEPTYPWESVEKEWMYEEETVQTNAFSYEDPVVVEKPRPKTLPQLQVSENEVKKLKFKGFNGRDAVIYQAIMNRPMH